MLFEHMIAGLVNQGYRVSVLTSRYAPHLTPQEAIMYGDTPVEVYRVGHNRYDFMRYALWKGHRIITSQSVDIIQTTTFNGALPSALLRVWHAIPTILHVHEIYAALWYRFI